MKLAYVTLLSLSSLMISSFAVAEGGNFFFRGVNFIEAAQDCSRLAVKKGDRFILAAQSDAFVIARDVRGGFTSPFIRFAVPAEGDYVVEQFGAFSFSHEFNSADLNILENRKTGTIDIKILNTNEPVCPLINCPAFGPCS